MNKYFPTLLLAVALTGLGAYVYFVEMPAEKQKVETETKEQILLGIPEREITRLTVQWPSAGSVVLEKKDGRWVMNAPLQTDADAREVEALLRALVLGRITRVVEEQATALEPFGLAQPPVTLTVAGAGRDETIALGDSGPISSTLYAMPRDRRVVLTNLNAKDFLNKSVVTFRKKELFTLDGAPIDRLRLSYPQTELVLAREEQPAGKPKWVVRYPIEAGADQPQARALVIKLEDLKALGFIDPGPERDALLRRLIQPDVKITVHAGNADQTVKLFRGDPASGEAYAIGAADGPIYRLNPSVVQDFNKDLFALQDKRLFGLDAEQVARLTVKLRDRTFTLARRSDEWTMEGGPPMKLDQQKAALFVSRVADLPAEMRVVKQTGPLAPYGLATPSLEITGTAKDGTTTGRLILGSKTGGLVYAMGQRLPGVYQARADLLSQVPTEEELTAPPASQ
jgi:hypothetical protein